ncbi:MAG TPA: AMP-binding protein, partial [Gaiellaceae bacterium]|nr:AMP-binding protein [Gaiellaceae bacterium]
MERRTAPELWRDAVGAATGEPAYLEEVADGWRPVSWEEAAERVEALAHALLARGVRHGDRVAVLARTRLEWILLDWAVMSVGAVVVGLYPTSSAKECEYILQHCEAVLAFAEDEEQTRKLVSIRGALPSLREVIPFDWLDKLEADGRLARHLNLEPVAEDDLATLIYTSGTTGPPKGCMLTHRNLVTAATRVVEGLHRPGDVVLLFLPLAHSYGRLAHQTASSRGATVALVADVTRVPEALAALRPHVLPAVPRVYEKVHANTLGEIERAGGLRRMIGLWALGVGARGSRLRRDGSS